MTDLHADVRDAGRAAARSPWVERLARFGYLVRGLLYATMGVLAVQVALGAGDRQTDQQGALKTLAAQPQGTALLVAIASGLASYALWGLVRAVLDPLHKGSDAKGLAQRTGYLASALTYGVLCVAAVRLLIGVASGAAAGQDDGSGTVSATAWLLSQPFGAWLVGIVGAWVVAAGIGELYLAYSNDFTKDLCRETMSAHEVTLATWVGRVGLAARGIVLGLVGVLVIQAALNDDADRSRGLDGALSALAESPFGALLLGTVAAGLIVFGLYSALCARWVRISYR